MRRGTGTARGELKAQRRPQDMAPNFLRRMMFEENTPVEGLGDGRVQVAALAAAVRYAGGRFEQATKRKASSFGNAIFPHSGVICLPLGSVLLTPL